MRLKPTLLNRLVAEHGSIDDVIDAGPDLADELLRAIRLLSSRHAPPRTSPTRSLPNNGSATEPESS